MNAELCRREGIERRLWMGFGCATNASNALTAFHFNHVFDEFVIMKNDSIRGSHTKNGENKALMTTQYTIQNK